MRTLTLPLLLSACVVGIVTPAGDAPGDDPEEPLVRLTTTWEGSCDEPRLHLSLEVGEGPHAVQLFGEDEAPLEGWEAETTGTTVFEVPPEVESFRLLLTGPTGDIVEERAFGRPSFLPAPAGLDRLDLGVVSGGITLCAPEVHITGTAVEDTSVQGQGSLLTGTFAVASGTVALVDLEMHGSTSSTAPEAIRVEADGRLELQGVTLVPDLPEVTMRGVHVAGGQIHLRDTTLRGFRTEAGGAALLLQEHATALLERTSFHDNHTRGAGGAIRMNAAQLVADGGQWMNNTAGNGGALALTGGRAELVDIELASNRTDQPNRGQGGGVQVQDGVLSVTGGHWQEHTSDSGAAIAGVGATVTLVGTRFVSNVADDRGGAVLLESGSSLVGEALWFDDNQAQSGGAMALWGSDADLTGLVLQGNHADADGGGIHLTAPAGHALQDIHLGIANASTNTADGEGGVIFIGDGSPTVRILASPYPQHLLEADGIELELAITGNQANHGAVLAIRDGAGDVALVHDLHANGTASSSTTILDHQGTGALALRGSLTESNDPAILATSGQVCAEALVTDMTAPAVVLETDGDVHLRQVEHHGNGTLVTSPTRAGQLHFEEMTYPDRASDGDGYHPIVARGSEMFNSALSSVTCEPHVDCEGATEGHEMPFACPDLLPPLPASP